MMPTDLLSGRPFVCPTKQVCVKTCPNATSYYKLGNYKDHRVCTYDVNDTNFGTHSIDEGKCAPYVMNSKPLFGRCVPSQLQSLANEIIEVMT